MVENRNLINNIHKRTNDNCNMEFMCKEISISDEEFGCTISFSDTIEQYDFEKEINIDEILKSLGQYIRFALIV